MSFPNLYKSARQLSRGPGGIILRKKSDCECLSSLYWLLSSVTLPGPLRYLNLTLDSKRHFH